MLSNTVFSSCCFPTTFTFVPEHTIGDTDQTNDGDDEEEDEEEQEVEKNNSEPGSCPL